jgi:hypothetical protein
MLLNQMKEGYYMANKVTKKQYDEIKERLYTVRVFSLKTKFYKGNRSAVGLVEAVEYARSWHTYPYYPVLEEHWLMQSAYLVDGNVLCDLDMTLHLLTFLKNRDGDLGAITEAEKVAYLESQNYTFYDAYSTDKSEKYNQYKERK